MASANYHDHNACCIMRSVNEHGIYVALIASAVIAGIVAILNGWKWSFLERYNNCIGVQCRLSNPHDSRCANRIMACWRSNSTMIYYGLMILNPGIFLFFVCILCSIVSLATVHHGEQLVLSACFCRLEWVWNQSRYDS